jgi:hypothetical protein
VDQPTPLPPSLPGILLLAQQSFDPTVNLFPFAGLESDFLRGRQRLLNLLQA